MTGRAGPTIAALQYRRFTRKDEFAYLNHSQYNASPLHRNRLAWLIDCLETKAPGTTTRILEIGCGTGNIARPIASLGHAVLGIDLDSRSVEVAAAHNEFSNLRFDRLLLEEADLGRFDVIVLSEVLEHVDQAPGMLRHISENVSPNAEILLTVPNGWSPLEMACRPSYKLKSSARGRRFVHSIKSFLGSEDLTTANQATPHVQFFTLPRLETLISQCDLQIVESAAFFFLWPVWEIFFSRRVSESVAERDFALSQAFPFAARTVWCLRLAKR